MEVTSLMLADDAASVQGKLYVHGGGWDVLSVTDIPATIARFALVLTLKVGYDESLVDHTLRIDLVDEDDQPAGVEIDGGLNVGHPPGLPRGASTFVSQAIRLEGLKFDRVASFRFRVFVDGKPLASLPFRLTVAR